MGGHALEYEKSFRIGPRVAGKTVRNEWADWPTADRPTGERMTALAFGFETVSRFPL